VLADQPIKGRPCRIGWVQRNPFLRTSGVGNIFVKQLHPSVATADLRALFAEFGTILSCKVQRDAQGTSKVCVRTVVLDTGSTRPHLGEQVPLRL